MAHITISDTSPLISYTVGSTPRTIFAVPFAFFDNSDLVVISAGVTLVLNGSYTVTGIAVDNGFSSGTVTFITAVSNVVVTIERILPIERTVDFPNAGPLSIPALNTQLDKLIAIDQQVNASIGVFADQLSENTALVETLITNFNDTIAIYPTLSAAQAATVGAGITYIQTAGRLASGDGQGKLYVRDDSLVANGFTSADGAFWAPVTQSSSGGTSGDTTDAGQWTGTVKHVFLGDSRTIGSVGTAWPSQLGNYLAEYVSANVHNFAVGSQTLATTYANYDATAGTVLPDVAAGEIAYLHLVCAGQINDYVVGGIMAAASFATLQALVARGVADGFRVIVGTEPKAGSLDATGETNRQTFNNLLLAWHTAPCRLARLDLLATDVTDAADFIDAPTGAHFTTDMAGRVAGEVSRSILGHDPLIYQRGRDTRVIGRMGIGIKNDPVYLLDLAAHNVAGEGFPLIAIQDLSSGGKQFFLYARAASIAGDFSLFDQTAGLVRWVSKANRDMQFPAGILPGTYTVATLPGSTSAGMLAYCSNVRRIVSAGPTVLEGAAAGTGGLVEFTGGLWRLPGWNVTAQA